LGISLQSFEATLIYLINERGTFMIFPPECPSNENLMPSNYPIDQNKELNALIQLHKSNIPSDI